MAHPAQPALRDETAAMAWVEYVRGEPNRVCERPEGRGRSEAFQRPSCVEQDNGDIGPSEEADQTALRVTRIHVTSNGHTVCCSWPYETLGRPLPKGVTRVTAAPVSQTVCRPGTCGREMICLLNRFDPFRSHPASLPSPAVTPACDTCHTCHSGADDHAKMVRGALLRD